ncbi:MAG: menaquinone biosynthesis protein [Chitinophagaceae bacterium]|nr:menaquinone biosynthesis protein [Chitinophagaceae bacterium]
MDKKWRIGAVSYLNTRPLLLGMEQSPFKERIDLMKSYPAQIAQALLDDTIDIGLVPVAIMPLLKNPQVISKYVIGTEGEVASVALFSQVPMDQIEKVYLDYQSRTSVALAKILFKQHWKKEVEFLIATEGYINEISGTTAGIIIGDRALASLNRFEHIYDLGLAWKAHTGLPFVFAAWVANKPIPSEFMEAFDLANGYGLKHLDEVIALIPASEQVYDLHKYYTENINYELTSEKRAGLNKFLEAL